METATGQIGNPGSYPIAAQAMLWAARPAAASSTGRIVRFTDVGGGQAKNGGGNYLFSTGTRWKVLGGSCLLDGVDTPNTSVANATEQQLNPNFAQIPAGVIGLYDRLRLWLTLGKSGGSDSSTIRLRLGPLGTVADPVIAVISSLATTNQSYGTLMEFKRVSATGVQKMGNADPSSSYNGASTAPLSASVTVSDMDANIMVLSITSQMSGGTETVTLQDYTLEIQSTDS